MSINRRLYLQFKISSRNDHREEASHLTYPLTWMTESQLREVTLKISAPGPPADSQLLTTRRTFSDLSKEFRNSAAGRLKIGTFLDSEKKMFFRRTLVAK